MSNQDSSFGLGISDTSSTFSEVDDADDDDNDSSDGDSSYDDSSYISSDEEDAFLDDVPYEPTTLSGMRRSTSAPALNGMEMSAQQISILLNQMKMASRNDNDNGTNQNTAFLTPAAATAADSNGGQKSLFQQPRHIQGQAMPLVVRPGALRRNSLTSIQSSESQTDVRTTVVTTNEPSPWDTFQGILKDAKLEYRSFSFQDDDDDDDFFQPITEERLNAYGADIIAAVRTSNVSELRRMYVEEGRRMDGCNRFGESVLHTACRRGEAAVLRFLVAEQKTNGGAGVDLRVRDDYGRTPMHDACWTAADEPNVELLRILLQEWPDLLLVQDKRGSTPLQYIRSGQWSAWNKFLRDHRTMLIPKQLTLRPLEEEG